MTLDIVEAESLLTSEEQAEGTGESLDLFGLDDALAPLRRLLGYCTGITDEQLLEVRHIERNASRWVHLALTKHLPVPLQEYLALWTGLLVDIDQLDIQDKRARINELHQGVCRLDAILGMPVGLPPRPPRKKKRPAGPKRDGGVRAEKHAKQKGSSGTASVDAPSRPDEHTKKEKPLKAQASDSGNEERRPRERDSKPVYFSGEWFGAIRLEALEWAEGQVAALKACGVETVMDLISLRPASFEVVQPVQGAGRAMEPGRVAVGGRVKARVTRLLPDGQRVFEAVIWGVGPLNVRWDNAVPYWLMERMSPGTRIIFAGELVLEDENPVLLDPELVVDDGKHAVCLAQYGIEGVDDRSIRAAIMMLRPKLGRLVDPLPSETVRAHSLLGIGATLGDVHTRATGNKKAMHRMAMDEGLLLHLGLLVGRYKGPKEKGSSHEVLHSLVARLQRMADVELSDEQQRVFDDIKRELRHNSPMRRVLTGEVGGGRGVLATLAAVSVAEAKSQVMLIAPDQATAEQRFAFAEPLLRELGLVVRLFDSSPTDAQRDALRRGEIRVVYGSRALLQAGLEFRKLGLLIIGERDNYGAVNKIVKEQTGAKPDMLVVTATPIPRRVLIAAYPQWDISEIDGTGVEEVSTLRLEASERPKAYEMAREVVEKGKQVIVVFPMSAEGDILDARGAVRMVAALEQDALKGLRVGLFHGAMNRDERVRAYEDFRMRRLDVLVATTHFEAGPKNEGTGMVIVEQADRMSLMRMHRLRGCMSHDSSSQCVLVTGEIPDEAGLGRVQAVVQNSTGHELVVWAIEQKDGFADLISAEELKEPIFQWLNPDRDAEVMVKTRLMASTMLRNDPGLKRSSNRELVRYLMRRWERMFGETLDLQVPSGGGRRRRRRRKR
jgi:ATP-dependent DNA helicase RecG